jgi:hypothetical protein
MKTIDTRRYEMLVRVRDFGTANTSLFPADSLGGQMFAATEAAVVALGQHAADEVSSRGAADEGSRARIAARQRLRTALDTVRRTARAVALDTPGADGRFRRPSARGEQALMAAARASAQDARAISAALVAHGLPVAFLDELDATIRALEAAIRDHVAGLSANMVARSGLAAAIEAGMIAVQRLDAIVLNRLRGDPATYAVWERARHVEQPPRSRNGARKPAPTPAPPAPVPEAPAPTT